MHVPTPRKGQAPPKLTRQEFHVRFQERFDDPAYDREREALERLEQIAWDAYQEGRKAPKTRLAGPGFHDPTYELAEAWLRTRERIEIEQRIWQDPSSPSRVLIVIASARNDGTCPGEVSKSWRLAEVAREVMEAAKVEADVLDLSRLGSEFGQSIHPCKGCVSTAMPLCHWPCSCYPHSSLGQVNDAMNDIYPRWVRAHGVLIVTPVYWLQVPTGLKAMIDRLVCADGGNPDPTSTHGKEAREAKAIELKGWDYPQHLAGRVYSVVVHGDAEGVEGVRRSLGDWLDGIGMLEAGAFSQLSRYIGYFKPYASSHEELDRDEAMVEEVRNAARSLTEAVGQLREGRARPGQDLETPRPK